MTKIQNAKIGDLVPDNLNANNGTEYGGHLMEKSLREFGAARSIVLDKNNKIIAGNKTAEHAGAIGIEDVIIVEATGDKIIAVKRVDIDLDSERGRALALVDNQTGIVNHEWNTEAIQQISEKWGVDVEEWGIPLQDLNTEAEDEEDPLKDISTKLIVECGDVVKLSELHMELQKRGFKCDLKE